jgi:hypothetical protein
MRNILLVAATALATVSSLPHAQPLPAVAQSTRDSQEQSAPAAGTAPANDGLSDLNAMTFGCPKAGLNAAAREAAKVQSQGTYQFSYFKIVNDSHHASYEVHFKSNYVGEPDLKYCVAVYCQQGWDPATTKTSVRLMTSQRRPAKAATHEADCAAQPPPAKRPVKRKTQ